MSGAFLTGDLFNLYVWFELMLIASFGLMVLGGRKIQLDATVKYGFLNFLATSFFLVALGLLYGTLGTLNMADVVGAATRADPAVMASIAALLLLAFGVKAAAFPVNAWLPASYHAPPPAISALLAGLLTKVGVYALIRTLVMLLPVDPRGARPGYRVGRGGHHAAGAARRHRRDQPEAGARLPGDRRHRRDLSPAWRSRAKRGWRARSPMCCTPC